MSIKLKDVIHMQSAPTLVITPSKKEYWFYIDHSYAQGPAIMDMTAEKSQVLEAEIISMGTHDGGGHGAVFYITEPEIKEQSITVEDATKLSSDIIYIYKEERAYATKPSDEMKKSVQKDFGIDDVEVLPESMYSLFIDHLSVDPVTGAIEAYLE